VPEVAHGLDEDLSMLIDHASRLAARLTGLRDGLGAFVHVENVTTIERGPAAPPRVVVLGLRFGAPPPPVELSPGR
jgi:hypothetical protein